MILRFDAATKSVFVWRIGSNLQANIGNRILLTACSAFTVSRGYGCTWPFSSGKQHLKFHGFTIPKVANAAHNTAHSPIHIHDDVHLMQSFIPIFWVLLRFMFEFVPRSVLRWMHSWNRRSTSGYGAADRAEAPGGFRAGVLDLGGPKLPLVINTDVYISWWAREAQIAVIRG